MGDTQLTPTIKYAIGAIVLTLIGTTVYFYTQMAAANSKVENCEGRISSINAQCVDEVDCASITAERNQLKGDLQIAHGTITTQTTRIEELESQIDDLNDSAKKKNSAIAGTASAFGILGVGILAGGGYWVYTKVKG